MEPTVSILFEMPENLKEVMDRFLAQNPNWDVDRAMTCAIALFLIQEQCDRVAARAIWTVCSSRGCYEQFA